MPYPEELKKYIRIVEKTRSERIEKKRKNEEFPPMTLDERDDILRKYHPDFMDGVRREVKVGPSVGTSLPHEFVDILEAKSRVDPDIVDLSEIDYEADVLVIGGGGSGTAAALLAQENGAKVILATKLRHGDANTMMAEGGIQACSKLDKDSPVYHYIDAIGGGRFKNDPDLVYTLVNEAPDVVLWLENLGMMFYKFPSGRLETLPGAGYCRRRLHFAGDVTGCEIMRTIRDEARNREDITVLEFSPAVELILNENGDCAGAVLYNLETEEYFIVKAKAVVLATGGCGRLHIQGFMTTNHYGATADGIVMGYRAGLGLQYLGTVQYHPTGIVFPEQMEGVLISEKFRAAGAHVLNIDAEQFVFEREPRDVEAAAYIRECMERGKGIPTPVGKLGVWLDSPMLEMMMGDGYVEKDFPGKFKMYKRHGIDISKEPMLVYPTLHYQNGGLKYSSTTETVVPGLFVAGEVGGGVHGENRLMGNSLLDILVFGRIAGIHAAKFAQENAKEGKITLDHVRKYHKELEDAGIETDRVSPMILPDYTDPEVRKRQLTAHYVGTLR
ncbi:MAG: FAD-binding protein [Thermodesulfobacteriota bacterium]|nr:FAD-binding protein [Thermodesulfobacteriota bacterium]